jgi:esterase/lipase superfamily enzyme
MPTSSPRALIEAVTKCWQELESTFQTTEEWAAFSAQLLQKLRTFDDLMADHLDIARQIVALFAEYPRAHGLFLVTLAEQERNPVSDSEEDERLKSPWKTKKPIGVDLTERPKIQVEQRGSDAIVEIPVRHTIVSVLFGTDRKPVISTDDPIRYSSEPADELSLGVATVSIPDDHKKGCLERPRWYRLEFRENPERHVVISDVRPLTRAKFVTTAIEAKDRDGSSNESLIFVHGFNVSFDESIRRTAQLACDLDFHGSAITYSWPSQGRLLSYGADANVIESSVPLFIEFVKFVQAELGLDRVHIIAHSMGSRLLARTIERLARTRSGIGQAEIQQVVFAAPDIDPKTFRWLAETFTQNCERSTLYAHSKDIALFASSLIYRSRRTGDTSTHVAIVHGIDTIDATNVDTSLGMKHSYFGDRRTILADMFQIFQTGHGPELRFGLKKIATPGGHYWEFEP